MKTQGCVYARRELVGLIANNVLKDAWDNFQTANVKCNIFCTCSALLNKKAFTENVVMLSIFVETFNIYI